MGRDLDELARRERLEYFRAWRAKNKDRVKKSNAEYWKRRAEKRLAEEQHGGKPNDQ